MTTTQLRQKRTGWAAAGLMAALTLILASAWLLLALLPGKGGLSDAATSASTVEAATSQAVTRVGVTELGTKIQVVYATPEYYEKLGLVDQGEQVDVQDHLVFIVTEENHSRTAPAPIPTLVVDGKELNVPSRERVLINSEHHRTRLLRFVRADAQGTPYIDNNARKLELKWPDMRMKHSPTHELINPLLWELPIVYPSQQQSAPLSPFLFLTLTAGLFAALSPCLIQLTLYYLSTLAGVGVAQGSSAAVSAGSARWPIVRTSLWFVGGVIIAYTSGGALAGLAGKYIQESGVLGEWNRQVAIFAGLLIVGMGLYTGAAAKAPMLCKLPLPRLTRFAQGKGGFGTMVMGFAIALGCLSCFGGAIFASLLVYVGSLGSPLMGAGMLFLFSLGIAIPFILAAFAWERVTPYLNKVDRVTPYIALASSGIMILLGGLMIADKFHWVSSLVLQMMPFLQV